MRRLWTKFKDTAELKAYFERLAANPHNVGQNNRKWKADLEYAGRAEVIAKVLEHEGEYADPNADSFYERERRARLRDEGRQKVRRFLDDCLVDSGSGMLLFVLLLLEPVEVMLSDRSMRPLLSLLHVFGELKLLELLDLLLILGINA